MKKVISFLLLMVGLGMIISCSKSSSSPSTNANVMFVNGCVGAANIDAYVNSSKITGASNLAYLTASSYLAIPSGASLSASLLLTATQTNLATGTVSLTTGSNYSIFAGGDVTPTPFFRFTSDDLSAPTSGNAKIRLANLCADTLNATVSVGSNSVLSNIGYGTVSSFVEVAAGTNNIKVGDPLNFASVIMVGTGAQTLNSGKIYTILLTGTNTTNNAAILISNN